MNISFDKANWENNKDYLNEYLNSLPYPMDSYMEDNLIECEVYSINLDEKHIGFAARQEDTLLFFYVLRTYVKYCQAIFDKFIREYSIASVYFQTSDTLLVSLTCDWEFEKKKSACFFIDAGRIECPVEAIAGRTFRLAVKEDIDMIKQHTGDFFDKLDKEVNEEKIYVYLEDDALLGCGIIERGKLFKKCASIGMTACKAYRRKKVGQTILWHLKEICYREGLKPMAGCWYYNTLSKKTLEKANMVSVARGMRAILKEKEVIPERTGNPPGELV